MHAMGSKRVGGSQRHNIRTIKNLLGNRSMKNVVIVLTQWENQKSEDVQKWDEELRADPSLFQFYMDEGAGLMYLKDTDKAVFEILEGMLSLKPTKLQIQEELETGLSLEQTTAGAELDVRNVELIEKHTKEMATLQAELNETRQSYQDQIGQVQSRLCGSYRGYYCDMCYENIYGERFHCNTCSETHPRNSFDMVGHTPSLSS
jgi:hypothetical protein